MRKLNIVMFGLSITSAWGNGHATTFRSLVKALNKRGHSITFFEKDVPWYAAHRDLPSPPFCATILYQSPTDINAYEALIAQADLVILGSYVVDAKLIARQISASSPCCFAFYDIDTPVTLAKLQRDDCEYITADMIPIFDVYFSFTGGPILKNLELNYGAQRARPLYCSVDPELYFPEADESRQYFYSLGYLGTYSEDRQPTLDRLLIEPARKSSELKFCVAGAQYPHNIQWAENVKVVEHIPPDQHCHFYNSQRFTLNVTRRDMIDAGYSPSVRLFEAGACATPVISDYWEGLDSFFTIEEEILVARNSVDVLEYLNMSEVDRQTIGRRMREKVLGAHTSAHRALEIERQWNDVVISPVTANS